MWDDVSDRIFSCTTLFSEEIVIVDVAHSMRHDGGSMDNTHVVGKDSRSCCKVVVLKRMDRRICASMETASVSNLGNSLNETCVFEV